MIEKVRVFIDYWNLQLEWNHQTSKALLAWDRLPTLLTQEAMRVAGITDYRYEGTWVYASVNSPSDDGGRLRTWLDTYLDRQPGINVKVRERHARTHAIHCRECKNLIEHCPHCGITIKKSAEKGVDSAIVTDLFAQAWENAYTIAILVSSDGDYVPAVEKLQEKGLKVINATWKRIGHQLAKTCWAAIEFNGLVARLTR
jgi:uncharacterized LabA/DUF88 family protein